MSIVKDFSPKVNPRTRRMLTAIPLPQQVRHLTPLAEQLPANVLATLFIRAGEALLGWPTIEDAIRRAVEFQSLGAWRCASCYNWQDGESGHTVLMCLVDGTVRFAILCARCERRLKTTERIYRAVESYVRAEVQP